MPFTFFDLLYWMLLHSVAFIVAKLLTQDFAIRLKESVYVILATLLLAFFIVMTQGRMAHLTLVDAILQVLLVLVYFRKINSYSLKKSFILTLLMAMIASIVNLLAMNVFLLFSPSFDLSSQTQMDFDIFLSKIPFLSFNIIFALLAALLFVKATRKLRARINESERAITVLTWISVALLAFMQISMTIMHFQTEHYAFIVSWEVFFLFGFVIVIFVSFYFYMRSERERMALRQQKAEQEALQYYTGQIEAQQTAMRKFKHDYQNILTSIGGFVAEENWDGLKQYMPKVETASAVITKDEFALESLSKIKLPEIKALLAAKLMLAQNINMNIHTTFEAHEEIDHIPVDSVALVRMLGIILDNAIEELQALGAGELRVACYKAGIGVTFVVQNTCRPDIPKLSELKQVGYSTKGEGRGLGLDNLAEMVAAHSDSLSLQTNIEGGNFTQKLRIGGAK